MDMSSDLIFLVVRSFVVYAVGMYEVVAAGNVRRGLVYRFFAR